MFRLFPAMGSILLLSLIVLVITGFSLLTVVEAALVWMVCTFAVSMVLGAMQPPR